MVSKVCVCVMVVCCVRDFGCNNFFFASNGYYGRNGGSGIRAYGNNGNDNIDNGNAIVYMMTRWVCVCVWYGVVGLIVINETMKKKIGYKSLNDEYERWNDGNGCVCDGGDCGSCWSRKRTSWEFCSILDLSKCLLAEKSTSKKYLGKSGGSSGDRYGKVIHSEQTRTIAIGVKVREPMIGMDGRMDWRTDRRTDTVFFSLLVGFSRIQPYREIRNGSVCCRCWF